MSYVEDQLILVRVVEDDYGNMCDVETLAEFEEYLDELSECEIEEGELQTQESVSTTMTLLSEQLGQFFEAPASLVERLRAAKEEFDEALNDMFDYMTEDDS